MRSDRIHMLTGLLCLLLMPTLAAADESVQTDWAGGPGEAGPVTAWGTQFDTKTDVSWLSIPGQLALAAVPLPEPIESLIADDAGLTDQVSTGDLDGDGRDDVISPDPVYDVFGQKGAIYWWHREPDGSWTQHLVSDDFYGAEFTRTADVDGDGDLDVVAAAYYGVAVPPPPPPDTRNGRFAWFENLDGQGGAWQQHLVGELYWGANWIDAGDLDGDGDIDLVGASELTDGIFEQEADVVWFENLDGAGSSWLAHSVDDHFDNASEVHLADLDGDGDLDILGANQPLIGTPILTWWENPGDARSFTEHGLPGSFSGSGYVDVGDLDGDGDLDVMGGGLLGNSVFVWENLLGDASSWEFRFATAIGAGRVLELVDIEGDGDLDALAATGLGINTGGAWWLENLSGDGVVWGVRELRFLIENNPWIAAGDTDGDGRLEAVVSNEDVLFPQEEQLLLYDLTTFVPAGELNSSILDGGVDGEWGIAAWNATAPAGSDVSVAVRASDDSTDLGEFVAVPDPGTDLGSLIDPQARYLQYRLTMAGDGAVSPILRSFDADALYLLAPDPGTAGEVNTLAARWGGAGDTVLFLASPRPGRTEIPGCTGVFVDLDSPRLMAQTITDAAGDAVAEVQIPHGAAGREIALQAVVIASCKVSNVVTTLFE